MEKAIEYIEEMELEAKAQVKEVQRIIQEILNFPKDQSLKEPRMNITFKHADALKSPHIDPFPKKFPEPQIGDYITGQKRPQGGCHVYVVTARRFHFGSYHHGEEELEIYVRTPEEVNPPKPFDILEFFKKRYNITDDHLEEARQELAEDEALES